MKCAATALALLLAAVNSNAGRLEEAFLHPSPAARPWVYWYFMDGNLSREGMTVDLEAMKRVGIGGAIMLEVDLGVPRGPVKFMSPDWQESFRHAAKETDRLGLELALGAGPGWCGSGGPWVKAEQSMQHVVASETNVTGPLHFDAVLSQPQPRPPFFGEGTLTPELLQAWKAFYRDVAVLAFPTPSGAVRIPGYEEKALFYRAPYSSQPGVSPRLDASHPASPAAAAECVQTAEVRDLSAALAPGGRLVWEVPPGNWTILRFGRTSTGQATRPAPLPGLGFESDKFDPAAVDAHLRSFAGRLVDLTRADRHPGRGLTTLHFDSWEMSAQNWSAEFREQFRRRRGYDPLPFLPATTGRVVGSQELSERFLWDLRVTAQELVVANHAERLRAFAHRNGLQFSLEPYDMNPAGDLALGAVADVPMCEFWSFGLGFRTEFSCFEAVSLAHTLGHPVVAAEAFTANPEENWCQHPASMKGQADWALCAGINRIVFHRYQHQPAPVRPPGMAMGPYGVHWERTQTWWEMLPAFHTYLSRCQAMLRLGVPVADILYLDPEGAPQVFRAPASATTDGLPDRKGYQFDACSPGILMKKASVRGGRITFPGGMSYRLLVLPELECMTPELLGKVRDLIVRGAAVVGTPPQKSPSLVGYPECDRAVEQLAQSIWTGTSQASSSSLGKGLVVRTERAKAPDIYPSYEATARVLKELGVEPDFTSDRDLRFIHRRDPEAEVYFVGNRTREPVTARCGFRVEAHVAELWDPLTGEQRQSAQFEHRDGRTWLNLRFEPESSLFVVFPKTARRRQLAIGQPVLQRRQDLNGSWEVSFESCPGPAKRVVFEHLQDWSQRLEPELRFYSGLATYRQHFDLSLSSLDRQRRHWLTLGQVAVMAAVRLNHQPLGVTWCAPWRISIPEGCLREGRNELEITVANLWCNRLIGDSALPEAQRQTWTTYNPFKPDSRLPPAGLLGPVALESEAASADPGAPRSARRSSEAGVRAGEASNGAAAATR
jgi:hypothetical protein